MALANTIKAGDFVAHYGQFRKVSGVKNDGGQIVLTIEEDGRSVERSEGAKSNLSVRGEAIS